MPLKVRRFSTSVLLVLFSFIVTIHAQSLPAVQTPTPETPVTQTQTPVKLPTSGDVMRERISKAKAFIAVRNYNAAIYELENIRRETSDSSVHGVLNVLLMNSYLEQGDYKRAQDFLAEHFNAQKTNNPNTSAFYFAVAGQVVKGARNRVERYRALGLNVSDRNLPLEAVNDIEKMRETLELVVTQSKEIGKGKDKDKSSGAMALLEEATNSRSMMARDDYDARRWRDEIGDAREQLASSRSVIVNAVNDTPTEVVAGSNPGVANNKPVETSPVFKPVVSDVNQTTKPADTITAKNDPSAVKESPKEEPKTTSEKTDNSAGNSDTKRVRRIGDAKTENTADNKDGTEVVAKTGDTGKDGAPMDVGSLIGYATKQAQPIYPTAAKSVRMTGVVKVEVTVNEAGEVSAVQKTSGPAMLQTAAKDAIRKWRFKPFVRDGQPVKATGFVSFNFAL